MIGVLHGNNSKLAKASQISPDPFPSEKPKKQHHRQPKNQLRSFSFDSQKVSCPIAAPKWRLCLFPARIFCLRLASRCNWTRDRREERKERDEVPELVSFTFPKSPRSRVPIYRTKKYYLRYSQRVPIDVRMVLSLGNKEKMLSIEQGFFPSYLWCSWTGDRP